MIVLSRLGFNRTRKTDGLIRKTGPMNNRGGRGEGGDREGVGEEEQAMEEEEEKKKDQMD